MNLKQLKYFSETVTHGSFSRASAVLGVDQPTLSRSVKGLEEEVGAYLLYRNGRGVQLTPAGTEVLGIAREFMEKMARVTGNSKRSGGAITGRVVFGAILGLSDTFSPRILSKYREQFPDVEIHVVGGSSGFIQEWLLEGRVDIGLIYESGRSQDLIAEDVLSDHLVLVATRALANQYISADQGAITLGALGDAPLALTSRHHGLRRAVDQSASRYNVKLNIAFEVDNIVMTKGLVRLGSCFAILPLGSVLDFLKDEKYYVTVISESDLQINFSLAYARNRPFSEAAAELARMIRSESAVFGQHIQGLLEQSQLRRSLRSSVKDDLVVSAKAPASIVVSA